MGKVCRICGKIIIGGILKHYEDKHFSIYAANKAKIESHPGAFVVSEGNELLAGPSAIKHEALSEEKQTIPCQFDKKRMKETIKVLNKRLGEQTYRSKSPFICNGCHKKKKYGKVIYDDSCNLHLCYDCYKYAKKHIESKRGNKHVFINTPM